MVYVPFLAEILKNHNKGTSNVLQGGGSAECGQITHFYMFCDYTTQTATFTFSEEKANLFPFLQSFLG